MPCAHFPVRPPAADRPVDATCSTACASAPSPSEIIVAGQRIARGPRARAGVAASPLLPPAGVCSSAVVELTGKIELPVSPAGVRRLACRCPGRRKRQTGGAAADHETILLSASLPGPHIGSTADALPRWQQQEIDRACPIGVLWPSRRCVPTSSVAPVSGSLSCHDSAGCVADEQTGRCSRQPA